MEKEVGDESSLISSFLRVVGLPRETYEKLQMQEFKSAQDFINLFIIHEFDESEIGLILYYYGHLCPTGYPQWWLWPIIVQTQQLSEEMINEYWDDIKDCSIGHVLTKQKISYDFILKHDSDIHQLITMDRLYDMSIISPENFVIYKNFKRIESLLTQAGFMNFDIL